MSESRPLVAGWLPVFITCLAICASIGVMWGLGVTSRRHLVLLILASTLALWLLAFAISRVPAREMCGRFVLVLASLGLTWGALEALPLTGLVDVRRLFRAGGAHPWLEPGNVYDADLLWRREPGLRVSGHASKGNIARAWGLPARGPGHSFELSYDSRGFRNEREMGKADIAVIGDSYIEAVETPSEQLVSTLLARSSGWTVANLGLSGYGPQQELAVLRRYAVPMRPKVVLWAFYEGNDLRDALDYEDLKTKLTAGLRRRPSRIERLWATNLLDAFYRMVGRRPRAAAAEARYGTFTDEKGTAVRVYFVDRCDILQARDEEGLAILETSLREAYGTARREGFRLVVVFVPTKYRVLRDFMEFPPQSECRDWAGNDLPARLGRMVEELSSKEDFLDLTPALAAPAASGKLPYLPDDTHWTPAGHDAAAQAIFERLSAETASAVTGGR